MSDSGSTIRNLRRDRGWSQREAARRAGVSAPLWGRTERGAVPRPEAALKIAALFGTTPTQLWPDA